MRNNLLVKNVRPMGGETVDVLVRDGLMEHIQPAITPLDESTNILDGQNQLLLPGLVNAHAHIDKNLFDLP